ncbi:MAG: NAD(P)-dependent oxidoreductase [Desulfofustis sp.]
MNEQKPNGNLRTGVVFGGSGLIGGTVVNFYKQRRPGIVNILAPSSKKVSLNNCQDIRSYLLSVRPDFVINAAIANINADACLEVNYIGAVNAARAAASLKIPYIFFSSAAALPPGEGLGEADTLPVTARLSNYAKSKLMAEETLRYMGQHEGLDYSCIRLGIVYGNHDHKIQGFHRLLFTIADESMPFLFTKKGCKHSYSNSRKIPYLIHHMLTHREEFGGQTFHFVDPVPTELADLIMTIKSELQLKAPRNFYVPYPVARTATKSIRVILRLLTKIGLKASLPPELMFLGAFYRTQTLSCEKLLNSSYIDPFPNETVYTRLEEMLPYYLTRWTHQNLITTFNEKITFDQHIRDDFMNNPTALLDSIHQDATAPFKEESFD